MRSLLYWCLAGLASGCGDGGSGNPDSAAPGDGASSADLAKQGGDGGGGFGDTYLPWEGGASYYAKWSAGPPPDPSYFPIAVWLQSPSNADKYKAIGVNLFIGLYQGPTENDLTTLTASGVPAVADQAGVWQAHLKDPIITAWRISEDEPDNAQSDGMGGYTDCIMPSAIVAEYGVEKAADGTRPIYLNLGQGTAYDDYIGRGSACGGRVDMYPMYEMGADIASFDIYPVNNTDSTTSGNLWYVAKGVDRLRMGANYQKAVWNWIETTGIDDPTHAPTPSQVKTEVWMSLVHGSMGIGYFCHVFSPNFIEAGLLANQPMADAVKAIDQQIHDLAPVLNTPPIGNGATVASSDATVPIDLLVKRQGGMLYVFAVAMRDSQKPVTATFTLRTVTQQATATVLGESRTVPVAGGTFQDSFDGYAVHLYQIPNEPGM